jgi:hypothetical protein
MIAQPTSTWRILSRLLDRFIGELNNDDLDDLHLRVERERTTRFLASYGPRLVPCANCGFVRCECFE